MFIKDEDEASGHSDALYWHTMVLLPLCNVGLLYIMAAINASQSAESVLNQEKK